MPQVILIDSKNALFRHAAVNQYLTTQDGHPTGAIYGCLNSMIGLHNKLPEAAIVWVWDGRGETWRHKFMSTLPQLDAKDFTEPKNMISEEADYSNDLAEMGKQFLTNSMSYLELGSTPTSSKPGFFAKHHKEKKFGYKANRARPELEKKKKKPKYPETPRERALLQIPILKMILEGCGIRNYEVEEVEGDDLLAMLAKTIIRLDPESEVYIHSGDKDYYQLLQYKQVEIIKNIKDGKIQKVTSSDVLQEYGVKPKNWAKYEALAGGHNNVPHIKGIGGSLAKKMLEDGIDPSVKDCTHPKALSAKVIEKYPRFFSHNTEKVWEAIHGYYKLCRLVDDPNDEVLSSDVRKRLAPIFSHFDHVKRFYRSSKGKTPEAFRKVSFSLTRWEMASILARRQELWEIP